MGGLLAMLLADARPDLVSGLVLVDPAVPVGPTARPDPLVTLMFGAYAVPAVARVFMSRRRSVLSAEAQAMAVLRLCCVDTKRVPEHVVQQHLELAREREDYPDVDAELVVAGRSLVLVLARRRLALRADGPDQRAGAAAPRCQGPAGAHRRREGGGEAQPDVAVRGRRRRRARAPARGAGVDHRPIRTGSPRRARSPCLAARP